MDTVNLARRNYYLGNLLQIFITNRKNMANRVFQKPTMSRHMKPVFSQGRPMDVHDFDDLVDLLERFSFRAIQCINIVQL